MFENCLWIEWFDVVQGCWFCILSCFPLHWIWRVTCAAQTEVVKLQPSTRPWARGIGRSTKKQFGRVECELERNWNRHWVVCVSRKQQFHLAPGCFSSFIFLANRDLEVLRRLWSRTSPVDGIESRGDCDAPLGCTCCCQIARWAKKKQNMFLFVLLLFFVCSNWIITEKTRNKSLVYFDNALITLKIQLKQASALHLNLMGKHRQSLGRTVFKRWLRCDLIIN